MSSCLLSFRNTKKRWDLCTCLCIDWKIATCWYGDETNLKGTWGGADGGFGGRVWLKHIKYSVSDNPCRPIDWLKGSASWKMTPLFYCRFAKSLLFHSRICMSFAWKVSHFGEISQKHIFTILHDEFQYFMERALMERALMERCAHWAPCFLLISQNWEVYRA